MELKEALEIAAVCEATGCISKSALALRRLAKEILRLDDQRWVAQAVEARADGFADDAEVMKLVREQLL